MDHQTASEKLYSRDLLLQLDFQPLETASAVVFLTDTDLICGCLAIVLQQCVERHSKDTCRGCQLENPSLHMHSCFQKTDEWWCFRNWGLILDFMKSRRTMASLTAACDHFSIPRDEARLTAVCDGFVYGLRNIRDVDGYVYNILEDMTGSPGTDSSVYVQEILNEFLASWKAEGLDVIDGPPQPFYTPRLSSARPTDPRAPRIP